jgi:hypothetical protein
MGHSSERWHYPAEAGSLIYELHVRINISSATGSRAPLTPMAWIYSLVFLLGISFLAVTGGSFWIDEFVTAKYAACPNLLDSWRDMVRIKTAEVQMPFFMAYVWAYEKLFGTGEWVLRLASVPWFVGGMLTLVAALRRRGCTLAISLVIVGLSPFAWYYLNEARLYAMQIGIVALLVAALFRLSEEPAPDRREETRWLYIYALALVGLSGLSMLGMIWASAGVLAPVGLFSRQRLLAWWQGRRGLWVITFSALMAMGLYYLWSVKTGARATSLATTTWQTVVFIFYELLGFAGMGPGRGDLRESGIRSLGPFLTGLLVYAISIGVVLAQSFRAIWCEKPRARTFWLLGCLMVPAVFLLATGVLMHFRVLGRHFAPLSVVLFVALIFGANQLWHRGAWLGRVALGAFVVSTLFSSLSLRFAGRHGKDDYRAAATVAKAALADGQTVWWMAEEIGAHYYGLPIVRDVQLAGFATCLGNPGKDFANKLDAPNLVIASKPDIYDNQGWVAEFIAKEGYRPISRMPGFTVWRRIQ